MDGERDGEGRGSSVLAVDRQQVCERLQARMRGRLCMGRKEHLQRTLEAFLAQQTPFNEAERVRFVQGTGRLGVPWGEAVLALLEGGLPLRWYAGSLSNQPPGAVWWRIQHRPLFLTLPVPIKTAWSALRARTCMYTAVRRLVERGFLRPTESEDAELALAFREVSLTENARAFGANAYENPKRQRLQDIPASVYSDFRAAGVKDDDLELDINPLVRSIRTLRPARLVAKALNTARQIELRATVGNDRADALRWHTGMVWGHILDVPGLWEATSLPQALFEGEAAHDSLCAARRDTRDLGG